MCLLRPRSISSVSCGQEVNPVSPAAKKYILCLLRTASGAAGWSVDYRQTRDSRLLVVRTPSICSQEVYPVSPADGERRGGLVGRLSADDIDFVINTHRLIVRPAREGYHHRFGGLAANKSPRFIIYLHVKSDPSMLVRGFTPNSNTYPAGSIKTGRYKSYDLRPPLKPDAHTDLSSRIWSQRQSEEIKHVGDKTKKPKTNYLYRFDTRDT
ncbi:hypothetical protein J6590_011257 [Homalodisca vitripennis]|nr:hypothetical protein J6590_011257 [Homalodisca vitripennis]